MRRLVLLVCLSLVVLLSSTTLKGQIPKKSSKVELGDPELGEFCKQSDVQRKVRGRLAAIRACHEIQLQSKPDLEGEVTLQWIIDLTGRVKGVKVVGNTTGNEKLGKCMAKKIGKIHFQKPKGGMCIIRWPFIFTVGEEGGNHKDKNIADGRRGEGKKSAHQSEPSIGTSKDCDRLLRKCGDYDNRFVKLEQEIAHKGLMNIANEKRLEWGHLRMKLETCKMLVGTADNLAYYTGNNSPDRLAVCTDGLQTLKEMDGIGGNQDGADIPPLVDAATVKPKKKPKGATHSVTQKPKLKKRIAVPYPDEVRGRGIQGRVHLELSIDEHGSVDDVRLVKGLDTVLDAVAMEAAWKMEFEPAIEKGKPVAAKIPYSFIFVLE